MPDGVIRAHDGRYGCGISEWHIITPPHVCAPTVLTKGDHIKFLIADEESIKRYIVAKRRSEQGKQIRRQYKNDIGVPYQLVKGYTLMLGGYSNTITTFAAWITGF